MSKQAQIALADMAYYWLSKGKIKNATECLEELRNELNENSKFSNNNTTNSNNSTYTWR